MYMIIVVFLALTLVVAALGLRFRARRPQQHHIPEGITAKVDEIMAASRARFGHGALQMHGNAVIGRLEQERADQFAYIDKLQSDVEKADRDMSPTEREAVERAHARVKEIDEQLKPLREFESLRQAHDDTAGRYQPQPRDDRGSDQAGDRDRLGTRTDEREYKYRSAGEFLADVYKASPRAQRGGTQLERGVKDTAADRLRSHGLTVEGGSLIRASAPHNTTAEVPGLIPHTIVGEILNHVDAARPFISSIGARDLGGIPGLTFERPTITQHVQVAKQTEEKATVANRQFEVDGIPFSKDTYGGWANVSRQSIDWTSPGVWDALMTDFIEQYGLETENAAADAFAAAVVQTQQLGTATTVAATELKELLVALYAAAAKSYQGSGRLPDTIWASLDWWAILGPLMDHLKATTAGDGGGDSSMQAFTGNLLRTNRVVVPSFPNETLIVGVRSRTEVYEDRFGFLSVVEPKVFGVEVAYGGYMASGTVRPAAFTKIVKKSA